MLGLAMVPGEPDHMSHNAPNTLRGCGKTGSGQQVDMQGSLSANDVVSNETPITFLEASMSLKRCLKNH